jgi:lysophospholipid acyltransferase (LPLAT)-like uncharacterized protein
LGCTFVDRHSHTLVEYARSSLLGSLQNRRGQISLIPPCQARARLLSFLASSYIRLVGWTSRIIWVNRGIREELEASGHGFTYAFWHGRQVFLTYTHQYSRVHPLISHSRDGELIARVCRSFGMDPVRGSSSRGGMQAILELKTFLEKGDRIGFTPDGPRGPLRQVQPGVLFLAKKTGCPIVPLAFGAKRSWVFKGSWDEFVVPKPFNRIAVVHGEPLTVAPDDDLDKKAIELKAALDRVTQEADSLSGAACCS